MSKGDFDMVSRELLRDARGLDAGARFVANFSYRGSIHRVRNVRYAMAPRLGMGAAGLHFRIA